MIRRFLPQFRCVSTLPLPTRDTVLLRCNKRIEELSKLGRLAEARQLFDSMPQRDLVSWNSMISAYSQAGHLHDACVLFYACRGKNVRTWTIMLAGYARSGLMDEARIVFESMPERNVVSWNAMIGGYVHNGDLRSARKLFDEMPKRNVVSWNSMITGYSHCGMMSEADELFDRMGERNSVSWMIMMSGYVQTSEHRKAWAMFLVMMRSGMNPDQATFVVTLSAITGLNDLDLVDSLRTVALKTGYEGDVIVGTAILNAYTRNGSLERALEFFETMPERNDYSWTTMIAALSQCDRLNDAFALYESTPQKSVAIHTAMLTAFAQKGRIEEARSIFHATVNPNVDTWNAMVAGYAQNAMLEEAEDMFLKMPVRNAVSWAAMIAGLAHNGQSEEALHLFAKLHSSGMFPNHSSFTTALSACANIGSLEVGKQIHSLTIKMRCQFNSFVGNGLISMYARCKSINDAHQLFDKMKVKDAVSWNSLISGLSENHMLQNAVETFAEMPERDVVSWAAVISAYEQAGVGDLSFQVFRDMLARGIRPNESAVSSLLSICASLDFTAVGEQIHALIYKLGLNSNLVVCNSLISMYFKCGSFGGLKVFEEMSERDIVTWNAVLAGCTQRGLGEEAIKYFERMKAAGITPDQISFLGVLCACSQSGSVDEAWKYFVSMEQDYQIKPSVKHYTCIVNLLGRVGQLSNAESLIKKLPVDAASVIWESLLVDCKVHDDNNLGRVS